MYVVSSYALVSLETLHAPTSVTGRISVEWCSLHSVDGEITAHSQHSRKLHTGQMWAKACTSNFLVGQASWKSFLTRDTVEPLIRTPMGQKKVSTLVRYLLISGVIFHEKYIYSILATEWKPEVTLHPPSSTTQVHIYTDTNNTVAHNKVYRTPGAQPWDLMQLGERKGVLTTKWILREGSCDIVGGHAQCMQWYSI